MKNILISLILFMVTFSNSEAGNDPDTSDLKTAMAYGTVIELNKLETKVEKKLLIRLYKIPLLNGTCYIETHGTCQNKYLVSVSTYDEQPDVNVFALKATGEVSRIRWIKDDGIDSAKIELMMNRYTKEATANNSSLKNTQMKINLQINVNKIVEKSNNI